MRMIIFGGRKYDDWSYMNQNIQAFQKYRGRITCIIQGGATGADRMGKVFATCLGIPCEEYKADWDNVNAPGTFIRNQGKRVYNANAGFDRNVTMAKNCNADFAMEFPGGNGTRDMHACVLCYMGKEKLWVAK